MAATTSCTAVLWLGQGRQLRPIGAQRPKRAAGRAQKLAAVRPRRQAAAVPVARAVTGQQGMTLEAFDELITSNSAVLVDFCTMWCGPCQVLEKNMRAIAPAWKDRVRFVRVDTEENPAVADALQVHKLPTLILFRDGKPVDRYEGLLSGQDLDMRLRANMMKVACDCKKCSSCRTQGV